MTSLLKWGFCMCCWLSPWRHTKKATLPTLTTMVLWDNCPRDFPKEIWLLLGSGPKSALSLDGTSSKILWPQRPWPLVSKAVPVCSCLLSLLKMDTKRPTTISSRLDISPCKCWTVTFESSPHSILGIPRLCSSSLQLSHDCVFRSAICRDAVLC